MFTGLIRELGEVISIERRGEGARLSVKGMETLTDAAPGDSISVNGVCLTAATLLKGVATFDVSYETLRSTNLGSLRRGDRVNLEPSLTPASRLGGHFVTGHIDAVGVIRSKTSAGEAVRVEIGSPDLVLRHLVEKGSVAVDGISLTVVDLLGDAFSVVIIPHTFAATTIGMKGPGDSVNLESDILGKYVAKFLKGGDAPPHIVEQYRKNHDSRLIETLKRSGFVPP
jgi:riboflavin synthase